MSRPAKHLLSTFQGDDHRRVDAGKAAVFEDAFDDEPFGAVLDVDFQLTTGLEIELTRCVLIDESLVGPECLNVGVASRRQFEAAKASEQGRVDAEQVELPLAQVLRGIACGHVLGELRHDAVNSVVTGDLRAQLLVALHWYERLAESVAFLRSGQR